MLRTHTLTELLTGLTPSLAIFGSMPQNAFNRKSIGKLQRIASLLTTPIVVVAMLLSLQGCERAKTKIDREVDRLCAIDGGVHLYETVELPKENFGPNGELFPQYRFSKSPLGMDFLVRNKTDLLVVGDPALERIAVSIVRATDQQILGDVVIYRRSGGDMLGPWAASRYSCPAGQKFGLEQQVFKPQEE